MIFLLIFCVFNPLVFKTCQKYVSSLAIYQINSAILDTMQLPIGYDDIVQFEKNNQNDIVFTKINTNLINQIAVNICNNSHSKIEQHSKEGVKIPLGAFSGLFFWANKGQKMSIDFEQYGSPQARFFSEFVSSGVNQTMHRIMLEIDCEINILLPLQVKKTQVSSSVLVCENIIIGKVPDYLYDVLT